MKNKYFGILGLGLSGIATADFFIKNNYQFILCDDNEDSLEKFCESQNCEANKATYNDPRWENIDFLIKSPGIKLYSSHPILDLAKNKNIPIISDIELFYLLNPQATYIGITGTNGKSTTTALIGHILKQAGLKTYVGGNIGQPVMSLEHHNSHKHYYVLELSSYQLASIDKAKFIISIMLNITNNHLEWHGTLSQYIKDKFNIIKNHLSENYFIFNGDDKNIGEYFKELTYSGHVLEFSSSGKKNSFYIRGNTIISPEGNEINFKKNKYLLGAHNAENVLASYLAAKALSIRDEKITNALENFVGLKHRQQPVKSINKISFINDSKATNFESTEKALMAIEGPIVLIMGGQRKAGSDYRKMAKFNKKIEKAFLIGAAEDSFFDDLSKLSIPCEKKHTLKQAFAAATEFVEKSNKLQTILLSPACASFDQWKNFEERGDYFIQLVNEYASKHT